VFDLKDFSSCWEINAAGMVLIITSALTRFSSWGVPVHQYCYCILVYGAHAGPVRWCIGMVGPLGCWVQASD
jgi:hypothetical protein